MHHLGKLLRRPNMRPNYAVCDYVKLPVTVKNITGWNASGIFVRNSFCAFYSVFVFALEIIRSRDPFSPFPEKALYGITDETWLSIVFDLS